MRLLEQNVEKNQTYVFILTIRSFYYKIFYYIYSGEIVMIEKISTDKAPAAIGPYSQAIAFGNMLFTSGQIPINPETGNVDAIGITEQTEQVMKNLGAVLSEAGSSFEKAIKTTCFLANISDFAAFNEVYAKYFTEKPARSCVAVKDLPKGVLVEVEVIAAI